MNNENEKKDNRIEITEMFMAEANGKCFYGTLKRNQDANGNPHLFSRIVVNDGFIMACASDMKSLGKNLDEMCLMVLDMRVHNYEKFYLELADDRFFLN